MIPRVTRQPPPNFHEIGEYNFQRLCNELFYHEPNVDKSTEYGVRGQAQKGIDLLAYLNRKGVEVAQCKCEKSFTVAKVQKASREFMKHLIFWKDQGVERFILMVACEITNTKILDEELVQRKSFLRHGIRYEIWDASTIRTKLRPYRSIAQTYLDSEAVVNEICGSVVESSSTIAGIMNLTNRLGFITTDLESAHEHELTHLRELSRMGDHRRALLGVQELKKKASWLDHSAKFRAKVFRFEAAIQLNLSRNVSQAKILVQEARAVDQDADYQTIETYIFYCEQGAAEALAKIEKPASIEAQNLRWGLLYEVGNLEVLEKESNTTSSFPLDAESYRLIAFLNLALRRISDAKEAIEKAGKLAPDHFNVKFASNIIKFFSAVSEASEGFGRVSWPLPVSWAFVKRDATSSENLEKAAAEFEKWSISPGLSNIEKENSKVWYLACHACVDTQQEEAAKITKETIECTPGNHGAVTWALHRGYEFDFLSVDSALKERLLQEPDNIEIYLAIWSLTFSQRDDRSSEALVDLSEEAFRRTGNTDLWLFHKIQFLAERDDLITAEEFIAKIHDSHLRKEAEINLLRRKARTGDYDLGELAIRIQKEYEDSGNAQLLLECCDLKLQLNDFAFVSKHSDALVTKVDTASALRLALEGSFKNDDYQHCLSLINNFQHLFRNGVLSPDIRQLRAVCMHKLGDWSEAITEGERIYAEFPNISNFLNLFDLLIKSGDTRGCSVLARELLSMEGAKPDQLLTAASTIRIHDLELARSLWKLANQKIAKNGNLALRAAAMDLAYALGLSREASELINSLVKAAQKGRGPLKMKTLEETHQLILEQREANERTSKLYMQGVVPIHLLVEFLHVPLVQLLHQQVTANRSHTNLLKIPILFGRAGNRQIDNTSPTQVIADITGIILMADLNLLDETEEALGEIYISPNVTISLMEQIKRVSPNQPDRCESRKAFCRLVKSGSIAIVDAPTEVKHIDADIREKIGGETSDLLEIAVNEDGILVCDGHVNDLSAPSVPVILPPEVADRVRHTNELTNHVYPPIHPIISPLSEGALILVPKIIVAGLSARIWEKASRCFRLAVLPESLKHLEEEIQADQEAENLTGWTQGLLDRLQRGIVGGKYRIIPASKLHRNEEKWGADSQSLSDILAYQAPKGSVVWSDDRTVESAPFCQQYSNHRNQ